MTRTSPGAYLLIESRQRDAIAGCEPAEKCRADAAWKMTVRQLAEARRRVMRAQVSPIWQAARLCAAAFV